MKVKFNQNLRVLDEVNTSWFRAENYHIGNKFDFQMDKPVYPWPRATKTRSGNPVWKGSPRKISDTHRLANSRSLIMMNGGKRGVHAWNQPYAARVFVGTVSKSGLLMPGRDWVTPVITTHFA